MTQNFRNCEMGIRWWPGLDFKCFWRVKALPSSPLISIAIHDHDYRCLVLKRLGVMTARPSLTRPSLTSVPVNVTFISVEGRQN